MDKFCGSWQKESMAGVFLSKGLSPSVCERSAFVPAGFFESRKINLHIRLTWLIQSCAIVENGRDVKLLFPISSVFIENFFQKAGNEAFIKRDKTICFSHKRNYGIFKYNYCGGGDYRPGLWHGYSILWRGEAFLNGSILVISQVVIDVRFIY